MRAIKRVALIAVSASLMLAQVAHAQNNQVARPKAGAERAEAADDTDETPANKPAVVPQRNPQRDRNPGNRVGPNQPNQTNIQRRRLDNSPAGGGRNPNDASRGRVNPAVGPRPDASNTATNQQLGGRSFSRHRPEVTPEQRQARRAANQPRMGQSNRNGYAEAARRWNHEHHNRDWWRRHCNRIILIGGGYYFWDAGYWYPAWGYDTTYSYYPYDGPIYAYNDLPPDQVISNVQSALQEDGYYDGYIDGELGALTREALARYQRDHGLVISSAVDEPTLASLGLL